MTLSCSSIAQTLQSAQKVLVVTHVYPDGDALGSQLALGSALQMMGKDVVLFGEESVSHLYAFLPGSETIQTVLPADMDFDCAVALDCGDSLRLGRHSEKLLSIHPFLVIDHHSGHRNFGDESWVDSKRSSTGEMIYQLLVEMEADLSVEVAFCLYAAIVSDTGSFKYSATTAETMRVAAELIAKGVKPAEVAGRLYDNYTISRLNLLQEVLATLALHENGRIAEIFVTRKMFEKTGATEEETENFINYPRSLFQSYVAVFMKETLDGKISVSMRSKGDRHDVAGVARSFGGGGHRNAAGFKLADTTLAATRDRLLPALVRLVREHG